jgi:tetratricopeptide (TPR) repeat protein
VQGVLLLAEALVENGKYQQAESELRKIITFQLPAAGQWKLNYLMARLHLRNGAIPSAANLVTNLLILSTNSGQARFVAETLDLQAQIFDRTTNGSALAIYEQLFALSTAPRELRKTALFKMVGFYRKQEKAQEVIRKLQTFIEQNPLDNVADLAQLALAEMYLTQYFTLRDKSATNGTATLQGTALLDLANTNLLRVSQTSDPQLKGRIYLNLGWTGWGAEKYDEARTNFLAALEYLVQPNLRCMAEFKAGDIAYKNRQLAQAVEHYRRVYWNYAQDPDVERSFLELGLYQCLRASLELGDHSTATNVVAELFRSFANSFLCDKGALLMGQDLTRKQNPTEARFLFLKLKESIPNSPLLPEIDLAIARTFSQERDWTGAIGQYELWLNRYANHPMAVSAEFARAMAFGQNGAETTAVGLMTNLLARFSTNQIAPMIQQWVADFYFNHEEYYNAEKYYQLVFQNSQATAEMAYLARLNAARAAFALQEIPTARSYLTNLVSLLIKDTNYAGPLMAEGWMALGDTIFHQFLARTNRPLDELAEAITAFSKVTNDVQVSNSARAFGRLGDCYFQWATLKKDPTKFPRAVECYESVLALAGAEERYRNQAACGIGLVFEAQNELEKALEIYLGLLYGMDSARPDVFWAKEAGLSAARLCEQKLDWPRAIDVYQRMIKILPAYQEVLEKKILAARTQIETRKAL